MYPSRIAPFAFSASTTLPFCITTIFPAFTSLRAASRVGCISPSQSRRASVPPTRFAASEGHIVFPSPRSASSSRIAASNSASRSPFAYPLQAWLQYFATSQSRARASLHANVLPHVLQIFSFFGVSFSRFFTLSGIAVFILK